MDEEKEIRKMKIKLQKISNFPEQIIKLWIVSQRREQSLLTECLMDDNEKIKGILNVNLIYLLKKFEGKGVYFSDLWKVIDKIDEETFNYIVENNLYNGIEKCNNVLNNTEYIKKLLDKGYNSILGFINEKVFFELIKTNNYKEYIFDWLKNKLLYFNECEFLKSDKIFIYLVNEINNINIDSERFKLFEIILKKVPKDSMTKEKVLSISLSVSRNQLQYDDKLLPSLVKQYIGDDYLDRSEDIKKILELGFIPTTQISLHHQNEYTAFIEKNFINIIGDENIKRNSSVIPNYSNIQLALEKGFDVSNLSYLVNLLQQKNLSSVLDEYKNNNIYKNFLCFLISTNYNYNIFRYINSIDDISKLFDDYGVTKEFIEKEFFPGGKSNYYTWGYILNADNIGLLYKDSKVSNYVKLLKRIQYSNEKNFDFINSIFDIEKYFDDDGPNAKFFVEYISSSKPLENIDIFYKKYPSIIGYSNYIKKNNVGTSVSTFIQFISEEKIELDKEILDNLLFDHFYLFNDKNGTLYLQYNDEPIVQNYINFLESNKILYSYEVSSIIKSKNDIKNFFTENGVKEEFYEVLLINNNSYSKGIENLIKQHYFNNKYIHYFLDYRNYFKDFIDNIGTIEDIKKYFSDDGITIELFRRVFEKDTSDQGYYRKEICSLLMKNSNYEKIFENGTCEYAYLKFCKDEVDNLNIYISDIDRIVGKDIYKYFDENGPKKIFYEDLFKYSENNKDRIINYFCENNKFEIAFGKDTSEYQLFKFYGYNNGNYSDDNTYKILFFNLNLNELNVYFGKNGPTKNLILKFLKSGNTSYLGYNKSILNYDIMRGINEENVDEYFDENGITDKFFNEKILSMRGYSLIEGLQYLLDIGYEKILDNKILLNFVDFVKIDHVKISFYNITLDYIYNYFNELGPKIELYEKILVDNNLFNACFKNNKYLSDYINRFSPSKEIQFYIESYDEIGFLLNKKNYILNKNDINTYYKDEGFTETLYELALFDSELFNAVLKNDKYLTEYITKFNLSNKRLQYINFIKENGFFLIECIKSVEQIDMYFDESGLNDLGINAILSYTNIYEKFDKNYFKSYYEKNFNVSILNSILMKLDNNYHYFMDFLISTLNLPLSIKEDDEDKIKRIYCLDIINEDTLIEIIKYAYFGPLDKNVLKNIISNNELFLCIKVYSMVCNKWDIKDFISLISNYENNKLLFNNIFNEKDLTNDEKIKLQLILLNGYKGASGVINEKNDLNNFNKLIYDNNNDIIDSNNIDEIRELIFNSLFNITINEVQKIKEKYEGGNGLSKLKDSINDPLLKNIIDEYDIILKFIFTLQESNDLEGLKFIASKVNELIKNGQMDILYELWNQFSNLDSDIMKICGEEINEKITNFDELLNTPGESIPVIQGEKSFFVRNISIPSQFEYDGKTIASGTNVKMIELNGLPFVSFGHVLNAFGYGGHLSDYNHPRVIGSTHLCLSAIDDNYYSLVERPVKDIDHVQLLFCELPAESLVVGSKEDVSSGSKSNDVNIYTRYGVGSYNPIRENISSTYHGVNGYNEYVYYRDGLMPSGILIRGEEPNESEIQAAAYLSRICGKDIPLVKVNKEKYPIRTDEEMKQRDEELKDYYKEIYEARRKNQNIKDIERLKQLRDYLIGIYSINDTEQSIRSK